MNEQLVGQSIAPAGSLVTRPWPWMTIVTLPATAPGAWEPEAGSADTKQPEQCKRGNRRRAPPEPGARDDAAATALPVHQALLLSRFEGRTVPHACQSSEYVADPLAREQLKLYGLPQAEFTAARNARAKKLRKDDPELAATCRRPAEADRRSRRAQRAGARGPVRGPRA